MKNKKKNILLRRIAVVGWVSFVSAAGATMFFFSMFDPESLGHVTTWPVSLSRVEGYSIGFFLFWLLTALSAAVTTLLLALPRKKLSRDIHAHQEKILENQE